MKGLEYVEKNKFMWLAILLLWLKTYLLYKIGFNIKSDNLLQELLLFINPLSSTIVIIGFSVLFKNKFKNAMVMIMSLFATLVIYADLIYYRFYSDFLTWPVIFQANNLSGLQGSIIELINLIDVVIFIDIFILLFLFFKGKFPSISSFKKEPIVIFAVALLVFLVNIGIAQLERPQLLTRAFDRELLVKNIGTFNYHVYDAYIQSKTRAQRVFADSSDISEVRTYTESNNFKKTDESLFGIAKNKNVIVISIESLQSFVINEKVDGEEITPFLNELIDDSYYFNNFYHQTAQGKTSDSEFIVNNSFFGKASGAVFFTNSGNEYDALPEIIKKNGYYSSVMHANDKSFWNRDIMYQALGYDHFYDIDYYDVNEFNSIGWGLKDKEFFEQSISLLKSQPEPYYTKFITLTNHFPFELSEEDQLINQFNSNSQTLNRYVTTVRYTDEALKVFFDRLKEEGLYENSIFIIYGDHYGISDLHKKAMAMFLGKEEITPFDHIQLQKVPMYVHIPGHNKHKVKSTVSAQIDVKPTIMHLLGIEEKGDIAFGVDLFSPERDSFAVLRDGSFITEEYVYTESTCYQKSTGEEIESSYCEPYFEKAKMDLHYSDLLINGDLLRFK